MMDYSKKKRLLDHGIEPVNFLKGQHVILAKYLDSNRPIVLKAVPQDDRINQIKTMNTDYESKAGDLKSLVIPQYYERIEGYDVFSYLEGYSTPWSEDSYAAGFGGEDIPTYLIDQVLNISEDLDVLGHWNGDFYWRNFVFLENDRVGLIDWDRILSSNKRVGPRLVYLYCLSFNNSELRDKLAEAAIQRGHINRESFRKGVLRTTQRFIDKWPERPLSTKLLMEIKRQFGDDESFSKYWRGLS